jgi:RimJ/RimL family protein N-acetyltransferase
MRIFLATERLVLRPVTDADAGELLALHNDPEVMRFINGGRPTSEAAIRAEALPRLRRAYPCLGARGYWAAQDRATGSFLGWFEFRPVAEASPAVVELGYRLARTAWGHGYATEGSRALIDKGFRDLGVERVTANTMAVNTRSRRVLRKAGLTLVRTFTTDWPDPIEGAEHGDVEYALTRPAWTRGQ